GNVLSTIMHVCQNNQAWVNATFNMAPYAGQTVRVEFLAHGDNGGDPTDMFVDDVTLLTVCGTPTNTPTNTPTATATATATPTGSPGCTPSVTMYGSNGNQNPGRGALITINQTNGTGTLVGTPVANVGLTGLAFHPDGRLFASTVTSGNPSTLIQIN